MRRLYSFFEKGPAAFVIATGLALMLAVSVVDILTGPELGFFLFYFAPIALVSWFARRRAGVAIALGCTAAWGASFLISGGHYSSAGVLAWNISVRGVAFVLMAYLVGTLSTEYAIVRELSQTDFLTGLLNKRALYEKGETERLRCERYERAISVAYIDLDHFKQVNDSDGHEAGDRLLRLVADTMGRVLRRTDLLGRVGGDEFLVALPEADFAATERVLGKLRDAALHEIRGQGWPVTLSVGAAIFPAPPESFDYMVQCADEIMYAVKKAGRDQIKLQVVDASVETAARD
jgi:diguanylate cyclase (GGDEF)-like protein